MMKNLLSLPLIAVMAALLTLPASSPASVPAGTKICSVVVSGNWRDTLAVPPSWTHQDCNKFRQQTGAASYQIGCLLTHGVSWGPPGGAQPSPNCGW